MNNLFTFVGVLLALWTYWNLKEEIVILPLPDLLNWFDIDISKDSMPIVFAVIVISQAIIAACLFIYGVFMYPSISG